MKKETTAKTNSTLSKRDYARALSDIVELRNTLADLVPGQSSMYGTTQLSNFETLAINNRYAPLTINRMILTYLYVEHGIIQTAIEQPVQDAIRGGLDITSPELDSDDIKDLQDEMERNQDLEIAGEACAWKRLFGGAGILVNVGQKPEETFDIESLTSIDHLEFYAADRWELNAGNRADDFYMFYNVRVHSSRVLPLIGKKAPSLVRPQLAGWGMSECERMVRDLNAYLKNKNVIFDLLDEAKIDVYRIKGFNAKLSTAVGTQQVQRRIQLVNQLKNYNNAVIMDILDEYEQKTQSFSGLAEMIKENRIGIASALRMPMAKLFGLSASGFSSGEDDIENYNAMVESEIRTPMRNVIHTMIQLRCMKLFGFKPKLTFKYKPLRMMSEEQEEQIKTSRLNRLNALYDRGLINSEEHAAAMRSYELMPIETRAEQGLLPEQPVSPGAANMQHLGGDDEDVKNALPTKRKQKRLN